MILENMSWTMNTVYTRSHHSSRTPMVLSISFQRKLIKSSLSLLGGVPLLMSTVRRKNFYFRILVSIRSALAIDINFVPLVLLRWFYPTRDLFVSTRATLFENLSNHLLFCCRGLPVRVLTYRCYFSTTMYTTQ